MAYQGLSRNPENWLILRFVFIHHKTVKVSQIWSNSIVKIDLNVFSWWIEKNKEVLIIFEFSPKSYSQALAEILIID